MPLRHGQSRVFPKVSSEVPSRSVLGPSLAVPSSTAGLVTFTQMADSLGMSPHNTVAGQLKAVLLVLMSLHKSQQSKAHDRFLFLLSDLH
jgi:hypothetical protein